MKNIIISMLLILPLFSHSEDCTNEKKDSSCQEILLAQTSNQTAVLGNSLKEDIKLKIVLREEIIELDQNEKGALLGIIRDDGDNYYLTRAGIRLSGGFPGKFILGERGWTWYTGAQIDKNTSNNPVDARLFVAGISGRNPLLGSTSKISPDDPIRIVLRSSINAKIAEDNIEKRTSYGLIYQGIFAIAPYLVQGAQFQGSKSAYWIYPMFGAYVDHLSRVPKEESTGTTSGGYLGINGLYIPGYNLPINFRFSYLRAKDFRAIDDEKRSSKLFTIGIEYLLFDPRKEDNTLLKPSISIDRRVGSNYMVGLSKTNETILNFRLRIDL